MAIDTRDKRASAMFTNLMFLRVLPAANSSITKPDRLFVGGIYSATPVGGAVVPIAAIAMNSYRRRREQGA